MSSSLFAGLLQFACVSSVIYTTLPDDLFACRSLASSITKVSGAMDAALPVGEFPRQIALAARRDFHSHKARRHAGCAPESGKVLKRVCRKVPPEHTRIRR